MGIISVQSAELKDKWLRCMAETENIRSRAQRDVDNAKLFGCQKFAKSLLSVVDTVVCGGEVLREMGVFLLKAIL